MWRRKKWTLMARMWLVVMVMACLTACSPLASTPAQSDATATPLPGEFHAEVLEMRTRWRKQNMPHYRIHFEFIEDASKPVVTFREVFVGNYAIRGVKCPAGACPLSIFKDVVSVSDVYVFMQHIPESCIVEARYDAYLYYPSFVSADCADGIPHPFALRITRLYAVN